MTKQFNTAKPTSTLTEMGFAPVPGVKKQQNVPGEWTRADGAKAFLSFGLAGRTGQSAGYTHWTYKVRLEGV